MVIINLHNNASSEIILLFRAWAVSLPLSLPSRIYDDSPAGFVPLPCIAVTISRTAANPSAFQESGAFGIGPRPGGSVRGEHANLTGLVLSCIEAKFCKKICVGKLLPRSTKCTPLHHFGIECTVL